MMNVKMKKPAVKFNDSFSQKFLEHYTEQSAMSVKGFWQILNT